MTGDAWLALGVFGVLGLLVIGLAAWLIFGAIVQLDRRSKAAALPVADCLERWEQAVSTLRESKVIAKRDLPFLLDRFCENRSEVRRIIRVLIVNDILRPTVKDGIPAYIRIYQAASGEGPNATKLMDPHITVESGALVGADSHLSSGNRGDRMSASPNQQSDDDYQQEREKTNWTQPSIVNNFHAPVNNVHGGSGDINVGIDPHALRQFIAQLHAFTPSMTFPDATTQAEMTKAVAELSTEKDRSRAAELTTRIRGLIGKASGPLKDVAIGVIDAELTKITGV